MRSNIVRVLVAVLSPAVSLSPATASPRRGEKDGGSGPSQGSPTSLAVGALSDKPLCKAVGAAPGCK
jgi:hypothetical protein